MGLKTERLDENADERLWGGGKIDKGSREAGDGEFLGLEVHICEIAK